LAVGEGCGIRLNVTAITESCPDFAAWWPLGGQCRRAESLAMTITTNQDGLALADLAAVIAHSQIVVANPATGSRLPAGFGAVDVAILEWIAAEGRRASRTLARM
jgi:hypothetical protein